ncbi:MAG: VanZ family protein [Kiritimatiellae bacterium]|nr:VanZ family protein [Kiritimatiellia bacterium]MDW8458108.1 VanZ family protein [Verrucomicrobiota bacterium]
MSWLPAALWAGLLFWFSSRPPDPRAPNWLFQHDKLTHAVAFGILGALAYLAVRVGHRARPAPAALWGWLFAAAYGATDEIHQSFVPSRNPDVVDWLADAAGAALTVVGFWAFERLRAALRAARGPR